MSVTLLRVKPLYEKTLEEKVEQLRHIDREMRKLAKIHQPLKEEIIKEMSERNLSSVVDSNGHELATYKPKKSPAGWDKAKFEISYPGIYDLFKIEKPDTYAFNLKS